MKLLLFILCLTSILAIKKSNTGKNDWAYRNIGELKHVSFSKPDRIFFLSERGVYGALSKETGEILFRHELTPEQQVVTNLSNNLTDFHIVNSDNSIQVFRFNINQRKTVGQLQQCNHLIKTLSSTKGFFVLCSNKLMQFEGYQAKNIVDGKLFVDMHRIGSTVRVYFDQHSKICSADLTSQGMTETKCTELPIPYKIHHSEDYEIFEYDGHVEIKAVNSDSHTWVDGHVRKVNSKSLILENNGLKSYRLASSSFGDASIFESNRNREIAVQTIEEDEHQCTYKLDMHTTKQTFWRGNSTNKIRNLWINEKTDIDAEMVVQYQDMSAQFYTFSPNDRLIEARWKREEGLAYIVDTLFHDYQNQKDFSNPYYEDLLAEHFHRNWNPAVIVRQLVKRVTTEVSNLVTGTKDFLKDVVTSLTKIELGNLFDPKKPVFRYVASESYEMTYGLRKMLMVLSKHNTLYNIDTKTSEIIWKKSIDGTHPEHIGLFRLVADELQRIILAQYDSSQLILIEINRDDGSLTVLKKYEFETKPRVVQASPNSLQIFHNDKMTEYEIHEQNAKSKREFIFYSHQGNTFSGYTIGSDKKTRLWSLSIPESEQLVTLQSSFRNDLHSRLPLFDEKKVFYKNIDFTNFAFVTKSSNTTLNLYVVNGANGHILFNKFKKNVDFTNYVNLAYDENTVVVSYFNRVNKLFELWVVEQYQQKVQSSTMELIAKFYNSEQALDSCKTRPSITFQEQVFGSPLSIKQLSISSSKLALLKRNIVIITRQNQVYSIDRKIVSTRRPDGGSIYESEKLPKYEYLLPLFPNQFISYDVPLCNLEHIRFDPTNLQSSLFLLAYGTDVFLFRWSPEQTFDMITEDFNYLFLLLVVIGITIGLYYIRKLTFRAKMKKQFQN